jgi:hypothetical protein
VLRAREALQERGKASRRLLSLRRTDELDLSQLPLSRSKNPLDHLGPRPQSSLGVERAVVELHGDRASAVRTSQHGQGRCGFGSSLVREDAFHIAFRSYNHEYVHAVLPFHPRLRGPTISPCHGASATCSSEPSIS